MKVGYHAWNCGLFRQSHLTSTSLHRVGQKRAAFLEFPRFDFGMKRVPRRGTFSKINSPFLVTSELRKIFAVLACCA
jgi:hypothetical protein